ncbi:site-specific DNA-methyltransferase [Telmatobacter bradus]|uniref:site-specific DNA-methyltransferase n=1 Tax=Telmatobacter bradus TaxID=474953 RepID=UPI003B429621
MPELHFKGKEFVYNHHLSVPYRPLVPDAAKSVGAPSLNGNLIIHGDNLHALKALLPMYAGKVDCIFIDPPYNTGNEGWSYNDNVNSPMMKEWLSSNPINGEDMLRHDKWCAMMWPRLTLLRELLSDTGSFWMTIDDNEVHHARSVLDEVFGPDRFIACVVWQKRTSPESRLKLGPAQDYILVYGNGESRDGLRKLTITEEQASSFSNPDNDHRGAWTSTDFTAQGFRPNQMYKIVTPTGEKYGPPPGRCWGNIESEFLRLKAEGRMWFGVKGDARPRIKTYLEESDGVSAWTWWTNSEVGDNQESKKEVMRILGPDSAFEYPKPTRLLSRIIAIATGNNSLILDSFAGSGTTAHAVLAANSKDGGNRRFILVEGENYADTLTAERVRRVIQGYEFKGTQKEELLRESLTWTKLKNADNLLEKVSFIEQANAARFDNISKTVKDGELIVTGEKKVTERTEGLGGEFTYCALGPELDIDKILTGETLPDYLTLGAWLFHTATGESFDAAQAKPEKWYLGESAAYHLWLVYKPELDYLKSAEAALTLSLAEKIAKKKGKRHLVFAPAKYVPNSKLLPMGVEYAPLPFALYRIEKG